MIYTFASQRQLSFIINVGGRNLQVAFGARNQAGVAAFMTTDEKVARAIRKHSLSRRKIIQETTKPGQTTAKKQGGGIPGANAPGTTADTTAGTKARATGTGIPGAGAAGSGENAAGVHGGVGAGEHVGAAGATAKTAGIREYDNYTVAREAICKEFGIKKTEVRNPAALEQVAKEHGITIVYKN